MGQHIERICYKSSLQFAEAGITFDDINRDESVSTATDSSSGSNDMNETISESEEVLISGNEQSAGNGGYRRGKRILDTLSSFVRTLSHHPTERNSNPFPWSGSSATNDHNEIEESHNVVEGTVDSSVGDMEESVASTAQEIPFVAITRESLKDYVGLRKYQNDRTYSDYKSTPCGVVTGLAYTSNGGCITYVETIKYRKNAHKESGSTSGGGGNGGNIKATGQLGKVMGESVEIAQCVARALLSNRIDCHNTLSTDCLQCECWRRCHVQELKWK